jgi:hypothetical protein
MQKTIQNTVNTSTDVNTSIFLLEISDTSLVFIFDEEYCILRCYTMYSGR